jgi:hypothetical protein
VLLAIDGDAVSSGQDVAGAIASRAPGTMVTLAYARDGEKMKGRVRLGNRAPDGMQHLEELLRNGQGAAPFGMVLPRGPQGQQRMPQFFGQGGGDLPRMLFRGQDGNVLHLDPDALESHILQWQGDDDADRDENLNEWIEELTDSLDEHGIHVEGDGAHGIRISIEDGKVTIERNGEKQVIDIDNASSMRFGGDGAQLLFGALAEASEDCAPGSCCEAEAECSTDTECEAAAECEAEAAVETDSVN